MTKRALAARALFSVIVAASLSAPPAARAEAVLEPTLEETEVPPSTSDTGEIPPQDDSAAAAEADKPETPPTVEPVSHLKTIVSQEAAGILGKQVIGAAGENIGMVVDVLIDSEGMPRAAVIDFGGFLGVGNRKIAVDWTLLQFRPGDQYAPILLDVTGEDIGTAPEYRPSDDGPSVVTSPPDPPPLPAGPPPVGSPSEPTVQPDEPVAPADGADARSLDGFSNSGQRQTETLEDQRDATPPLEMRPPNRSPRTTAPAPDPELDDEAVPEPGSRPGPEPVPPAPSAPSDVGE